MKTHATVTEGTEAVIIACETRNCRSDLCGRDVGELRRFSRPLITPSTKIPAGVTIPSDYGLRAALTQGLPTLIRLAPARISPAESKMWHSIHPVWC